MIDPRPNALRHADSSVDSQRSHFLAQTDESLSPSLRRERSGATARELKFSVSLEALERVTALLASRLQRDPHGDSQLDGDYSVASLYFDTPDLEVFRRVGWHRFRKFRVRRYGNSASLFLERKTRLGDLVRKDRTAVPFEQLEWIGRQVVSGAPTNPQASTSLGGDFAHQLARRGLRPTCFIEYRRRAFFGSATRATGSGERPADPIRVTIDRDVRGALADGWTFAPSRHHVSIDPAPSTGMPNAPLFQPLLQDTMVLEIKCASDARTPNAVPALAKELIEALRLSARGASKYRQCIRQYIREGFDQAAGSTECSLLPFDDESRHA